jgi:hypothetical protein
LCYTPVMELLKIAKLPISAMKFAGKQLLGGAFGELGNQYGEATGGHKVHPASLQFYRTPETGDNIQLGDE